MNHLPKTLRGYLPASRHLQNSTWWLAAILLLAAALRFHRLAEISLRADEAANILLATQDLGSITRVFIAADPHLPLFYWLLHFWMPLTGRSELAVRYPTVFAGIVSVALVYALGKQLFPRRPNISPIAAGLAAINPYLIWDAQDAYMYSLLTALALVSTITFLRVMKSNAPLRVWVIYVVANALGLFLHYLAALPILAQNGLWLLSSLSRRISFKQTMQWFSAQMATVVLFLPWLVFVFPLLSNFKLDFFPPANLIEILTRSLVAFSVGRADSRLMPPMVEPVVGGSLAIGFGVLFLLGFISFKHTSLSVADTRVILLTLLAVPLAAIWLFSIARFPIYDERYVLFLIPAFLLMVARGIDFLHESRWRFGAAIASVYIVLASAYSLNNYFNVPAFAKSPAWRSFTRQLLAQAQPGDALIQNYPDPALPYYLQERLPRILLPRTGSSTMNEIAADLKQITGKFSRVWFQPAPNSTWDTESLVATWLVRHARRIEAYPFQGVNLELYLTASTALRQAQPINATFANQIRLVAFDAERVAKPGSIMELGLYWTTDKQISRDATVFVHLYDDAGNLVSQQDSQPINGTYPFTQWNRDEMIVDVYALTIPANAPAGKYSLVVGLYDSQTQVRVSVIDPDEKTTADNRVMLMSVEVRR